MNITKTVSRCVFSWNVIFGSVIEGLKCLITATWKRNSYKWKYENPSWKSSQCDKTSLCCGLRFHTQSKQSDRILRGKVTLRPWNMLCYGFSGDYGYWYGYRGRGKEGLSLWMSPVTRGCAWLIGLWPGMVRDDWWVGSGPWRFGW